MATKEFPINLQSFREIRTGNFHYIDKSEYIYKLASRKSRRSVFLSRPRRFGKTLLTTTFEELFKGSEELFRGLYIHDKWDWNETYPIVRIDFGSLPYDVSLTPIDGLASLLLQNIKTQFRKLVKKYDLVIENLDAHTYFYNLLDQLYEKTGKQIVIIVDEYDKPLLDAIPFPEKYNLLRHTFKNFYTIIKGLKDRVRFSFLTGITKFAGVSLFSGINSIHDISLDPNFATICGFTQKEIETELAEELVGKDLTLIKKYYNGYSWGGDRVYNPIDLSIYLSTGRLDDYWIDTGRTSFLYETLKYRLEDALQIQNATLSLDDLNQFDLDVANIPALLFQSGYLTLKNPETLKTSDIFELQFPNEEVYNAYYKDFIHFLNSTLYKKLVPKTFAHAISEDLDNCNWKGIETRLTTLVNKIPYHWTHAGNLTHYEGYFCMMFYAYLAGIGKGHVTPEESSAVGRVDIAIHLGYQHFFIEVKLLRTATDVGNAMSQLHDRDYAAAWRAPGETCHLIGLEVDEVEGRVALFEHVTLPTAV